MLVSIALISGSVTFGASTIVSVAVNSITFGRGVLPAVFTLHGYHVLVISAVILEIASYIACTTVGFRPIARGLISLNHARPEGSRLRTRRREIIGPTKNRALTRFDVLGFAVPVVLSLTIAAVAESLVLI